MAFLRIARSISQTSPHMRSCLSSGESCRTFASGGGHEPVYVVFGAAGAVGSSLVERLAAQQGAKVLASDRDDSGLESLQSVQGASLHPADTEDEAAVRAVIDKAMQQHGRVDGVASCVGNMLIKPAHLTSTDEYMACIMQNAFSSFNILKGSVQAMMKDGGSIAFCSSSIAHRGMANHDALAAAKGAISSMALSAASTYSPHNIRVNVVVPGVIAAKMTTQLVENEQARDASERMHALGRIGQPEDVSRALEFLLDPVNSFITGAFLHVDGGLGSIAPARAGDAKSVKSSG